MRVPDRLDQADFANMPAWMRAQHFFNLSHADQVDRLIAGLKGPSKQVRVPHMAPQPDTHFVVRREEGEKLMALMVHGENAAAGITAALRGAGGYGKTQLARWIAQQEIVEDAFYDGVLWIELGERPNVHALIDGLIKALADEAPGLPNATMASARLKEIIDKRHMLLVIDDAWNGSDLEPFIAGAPNLVRLITTRLDHVLPHDAAKVPIDAMKPVEATELLAVGLPEGDSGFQRAALLALARRLGEWPLLLTLANALLRDEVDGGTTVADAIAFATRVYDEMGLQVFESGDEASRNSAARLSIGASLRRLDAPKGEVARFEELALFPEYERIPVATVTRLWQATSGLHQLASEVLLRTLRRWALLMDYDRRLGTIRLHDVMPKFLRDRVGVDRLIALNKVFATTYAGMAGVNLGGDEQLYYYRYLPQHLKNAGERDKLDALLLDPGWLKAKLDATESPLALAADYEQFGNSQIQIDIGRTLRLTTAICARDPRQLLPQLLGRLMGCTDPAASRFLEEARRHLSPPAIIEQRPSLTPPGAEVARLEGHASGVAALAALPGGRLASASHDNTIRLWDVARGAEIAHLEGHASGVRPLAVLPDSRLASGSDDNTIRLWDLVRGAEIARLDGHVSGVRALAVMPNGRLASGSADRTIRLWDVACGVEVARLEGHASVVEALAVLPDGRLASGSDDNTIRLWDIAAGTEIARFQTNWVRPKFPVKKRGRSRRTCCGDRFFCAHRGSSRCPIVAMYATQ